MRNQKQKRVIEGDRKRRLCGGVLRAVAEGRSRRGKEAGEGRDKKGGRGCNTRTSQEVTHPSTTLAQTRLTLEF
ncbi:unnamed protein product [Victoria cruziana]